MDNNKVMHDDGTQLEWKKHDPEILHYEMPNILNMISKEHKNDIDLGLSPSPILKLKKMKGQPKISDQYTLNSICKILS